MDADVLVNRVTASRLCATWGRRAKTRDAAVTAMLNGSLSDADSGTLLRIAAAVERIAVLLDPVLREKDREEAARLARIEATHKRARARGEHNAKRLRPFVTAYLAHEYFARLKAAGKSGILVYNAVEYGLYKARQYAAEFKWYRPRLRDLLRTPPEELRTKKIHGLGPRKKHIWDEIHEQIQNGR